MILAGISAFGSTPLEIPRMTVKSSIIVFVSGGTGGLVFIDPKPNSGSGFNPRDEVPGQYFHLMIKPLVGTYA